MRNNHQFKFVSVSSGRKPPCVQCALNQGDGETTNKRSTLNYIEMRRSWNQNNQNKKQQTKRQSNHQLKSELNANVNKNMQYTKRWMLMRCALARSWVCQPIGWLNVHVELVKCFVDCHRADHQFDLAMLIGHGQVRFEASLDLYSYSDLFDASMDALATIQSNYSIFEHSRTRKSAQHKQQHTHAVSNARIELMTRRQSMFAHVSWCLAVARLSHSASNRIDHLVANISLLNMLFVCASQVNLPLSLLGCV